MRIEVQSGPWSPAQIERWLAETVIPVRIATMGSRGPLVQSVWFSYADGGLWCATQRDSVLATRIRRAANVGWEIARDEPPYRGVRGSGVASLSEDPKLVAGVLSGLIERYQQSGTQLAQWLESRIATEVAVRIDDLRVTSWDYAPRMSSESAPGNKA